MAGGAMPDLSGFFYLAAGAVGAGAGLVLAAIILALGANPWIALACVPAGAAALALLAWWRG